MLHPFAAGAIAGIVTNVTGYAITGRLFHSYQQQTPNTWRTTESHAHYLYSAGVRIVACIGIVLLYGVAATSTAFFGGEAASGAALFGVCLWMATAAPVIVEVAIFVNWHPVFVAGLLLDWLAVCVIAALAAYVAERVI